MAGRRASSVENRGLGAGATEIRRLLMESSLESLGLASGLLENLTKEIQYALENGIVYEPSDLRLLVRELSGLQLLAEQGSRLAAGHLQALLGPAMDCFGGQANLESRAARIQVQA
ncbi:hypothetical protein [uncultured Paludibaculum sp.]|uniref:hypothetical protein n=1 Tax=uncultured Paludibaculum sp. TaxID=1765020 RepID=UPI002AAB6D85|nr:hypothetical protein [uncultured Paludibaculum sp.]